MTCDADNGCHAVGDVGGDGGSGLEPYVVREVLCFTPEHRRVDMLTITGSNGRSSERMPYVSPCCPVRSDVMQRPHIFPKKQFVLITARVHPGETPSSHVVHGIIDYLLFSRDVRAVALRDRFVFVIIPMLNPDGVAKGHYRCDSRGTNLNRVYDSPDPTWQPSIACTKQMFQQLVNPSWAANPSSSSLALYLDLHAHTSKKYCFVFGNHTPGGGTGNPRTTDAFPRYLAARSSIFDLNSCDFSQRSMTAKGMTDGTSKSGTGRVALSADMPLDLSALLYTVEISYNLSLAAQQRSQTSSIGVYGSRTSSSKVDVVPAAASTTNAPPQRSTQDESSCISVIIPQMYVTFGQSLLHSLLDLDEARRKASATIR